MYNKILLTGFRATGKTTVGKELARELSWDFVDMDEEIVKRAGMTVMEITDGGKFWLEFRRMESELLSELLSRRNIVVGTGGGVLVNNIVDEGTLVEFGRRNVDELNSWPNVLVVLLTASDDVIYDRMKADEMSKEEVLRPILDEKSAQEFEIKLEQFKGDPEKQKEVIVEEILNDSVEMLKVRRPLYKALANMIVDTGIMGPNEAVKEIIKHL